MGKRSAVVELFLGDMGSIQRETRPSIQREDQLTMETQLEQIAVKATNQLPKSVPPRGENQRPLLRQDARLHQALHIAQADQGRSTRRL